MLSSSQKTRKRVGGDAYRRSNLNSFSGDFVSVSKTRNVNLISHLTNADLSLLTDFDKYKDELSIVHKSFVTMDKPIKKFKKKCRLHIRDTMLLTAGNKSLSTLGKMYGDSFEKIKISSVELENMAKFLQQDPVRFKEYALQDSIIVLVHACYMEDYYFKLDKMGVPLTLSAISKALIAKDWRDRGYKGYQVSPNVELWDVQRSYTPKGIFETQGHIVNIGDFIANYKGGRNESFMYGIDKEGFWYDYDLTSAYTTVMFALGHPLYKAYRVLTVDDLDKRYREDPVSLIYSYIIVKGTFKFPDSVKYPSIPMYIDETTTVYPQTGLCNLTGAEYLLARNQGCEIVISSIIEIPFSIEVKDERSNENSSNVNDIVTDSAVDSENVTKEFLSYAISKRGKRAILKDQPYASVIMDIQRRRRSSVKGSLKNTMDKLMGNSMYGLVVQGISHKVHYDIPSKSMKRMEGSKFSNAVLAS